MRVLGIEVDDELVDRWWSWLAPAAQPFFVTQEDAGPLPSSAPADPPRQLDNTYTHWRVDRAGAVAVWLDEPTFSSLPRRQRASLVREQRTRRRGAVPSVRSWSDLLDPAVLRAHGDGHRFVWWPSMATGATRRAVVSRAVAHAQPASRHEDVADATWRAAARSLPLVEELAGSFPQTGRHNCFGSVMAAAGAHDPADAWVDRPPFEAWLAAATVPCGRGRDDDPGIVLLWRDAKGDADHAAVTCGDGWAFAKASEDWWTPRVVLPTRALIAGVRSPGYRLERRRIQAG